MLALFAAPAAAADCTASWVRETADRSAAAVQQDDVGAHRAAYDELVVNLGCLVDPLPRAAWARLQLDEAIVRYAQAGDWQQPLAAALRADPTLTLPPFLSRAGGAALKPLPGGLRWRTTVDGVPIDGPVRLEGFHVVQAETDAGLRTEIVRGDALPAELVVAQGPGSARSSEPSPSWVVGGVGVGWAEADQSGAGGPRLDRTAQVGATVWGVYHVAGPVGVLGDAGVALGDGVLPSGRVAAALGTAAVAGWVGAGLVPLRVADVDGRRGRVLLQPAVGVVARTGAPRALDGWVGLGLAPGTWNVDTRLGAIVADVGPLAVRVGAEAGVVRSAFADAARTRTATVTRGFGGLQVGVASR